MPVVEETRVLIATAVWLLQRGPVPYRFSVARGKGINTSEILGALSNAYKSLGTQPAFSSVGADVEALSDTEWWRVECKGTGIGKSQTQRNNFDRALSSAVTYFEEPPYSICAAHPNARLFLGLALPASPEYTRELRRRVRPPLRKCLNLWVLLYEHDNHNIRAVAPSEEI